MRNGEPDETRAFARLPGLDIAVVHRSIREGHGEQVMIAFRTAPPSDPLRPFVQAAWPFLFWVRLTQVAWTSWLGSVTAGVAPPWMAGRE